MSSSSPENYSLEEMMERLKAAPSQDPSEGELVTRPDGTQAIRVRKRKRRSQQPKREEAKRQQRVRAIQIGGALVVLILLTLVIGGAYLYTNTAPFRNKLSEALAAELGADVQLREFRVTPVNANASALTMTWPEGGFPAALDLRGIKAKVSPSTIFGRAFSGDEVSVTEGKFTLQQPNPNPPAPVPRNKTMPIRFARVAVNKLDVAYMDRSSQVFLISRTEGTLSAPAERTWKTLDFHQGSFAFHGLPTFRLDRARMELHPGEIRILGLRMNDTVTPKGDFDLSGSVNTLEPDTRSVLAVKLSAFNLADLFGPELAKFLQVRLDTRQAANSNFFAFSAGNPRNAELSVAFANSSRDLRKANKEGGDTPPDARSSKPANDFIVGFTFLDFLAKAADDPFYNHPAFEEITGIISSKNGQITVSELECLRKSRFALKGDFTIGKNKSLAGTLQIGLPEGVLSYVQDKRFKAMFGPLVRDFHWATVNLSGSTDIPTDDFAKSYSEANPSTVPDDDDTTKSAPERGGNPIPPARPETPGSSIDPGKAFEDLTQPVK